MIVEKWCWLSLLMDDVKHAGYFLDGDVIDVEQGLNGDGHLLRGALA
jgi:hypothetical protein